jgi:hypothetical protein
MLATSLSNDLKDKIIRWYYEDQDTMAKIAARARCAIGPVSNVLPMSSVRIVSTGNMAKSRILLDNTLDNPQKSAKLTSRF